MADKCNECNKCECKNNATLILCPNPDAADLYVSAPVNQRGDSGIDLRFPCDIEIPSMFETNGLPTIIDLKVKAAQVTGDEKSEIIFRNPFYIVPRSSIGKTPLSLANSVGIIDRGYNGTLKVAVRNFSNISYSVKRGTSLFQVIHHRMEPMGVHVVSDHFLFADTVRGEGCFGSTGAKGI